MAENHPFSVFVKILGRGKNGTRSLTQAEAKQAMSMILSGEAEEAQIGAFLMLLRVKEESPEELAGFVEASCEHIAAPKITIDVDWSSYAGKKNQLPWHLISAKLLAQNGYKILIHGADGTQDKRLYTEQSCNYLHIGAADSWQHCKQLLESHRIAFMPMRIMSASFHELLFYRRLLGLRSVMHSQARLLNPLKADISLQGVFHPAYGPSHQQASLLLGRKACAGFKGEGGEAEIRPEAATKIHLIRDYKADTVTWQKSLPQRPEKQTELDLSQLDQLWQGANNAYGEASVISTTALVVYLKDSSLSIEQAFEQAKQMWANRA